MDMFKNETNKINTKNYLIDEARKKKGRLQKKNLKKAEIKVNYKIKN